MMFLNSLCLWVYRAAAETGQSLRSSLQLVHSLGCTGLHQWRPAGSGNAPRPAMGMITCCAPRLLCTQTCCAPGQVGPLCPSVIWALVVADLRYSLVFRYWVGSCLLQPCRDLKSVLTATKKWCLPSWSVLSFLKWGRLIRNHPY